MLCKTGRLFWAGLPYTNSALLLTKLTDFFESTMFVNATLCREFDKQLSLFEAKIINGYITNIVSLL